MAVINDDELKNIILDKFNKAQRACLLSEGKVVCSQKNISNNIPEYDIEKMKFCEYMKDTFVSFFADMRNSTIRAENLGPEKTFLTIHAIMPAMIYVVESYCGNIVDLPGDGVMALFKKNTKNIYWRNSKENLNPEELALRAGEELLRVINEIVNPILNNSNIESISFGVGIDTGSVIVTKVGTDETRDIKAIGTCINKASKMSNCNNKIFISDEVYKKVNSNLKKNYKKVDDTLRKEYKEEVKDIDGYIKF